MTRSVASSRKSTKKTRLWRKSTIGPPSNRGATQRCMALSTRSQNSQERIWASQGVSTNRSSQIASRSPSSTLSARLRIHLTSQRRKSITRWSWVKRRLQRGVPSQLCPKSALLGRKACLLKQPKSIQLVSSPSRQTIFLESSNWRSVARWTLSVTQSWVTVPEPRNWSPWIAQSKSIKSSPISTATI